MNKLVILLLILFFVILALDICVFSTNKNENKTDIHSETETSKFEHFTINTNYIDNSHIYDNIYDDFDIYVININQTLEGKRRRWVISRRKDELFKKSHFYQGIYGKQYDYSEELSNNIFSEYWDFGKWKGNNSKIVKMDKGEIGIILSNYYLWKKIADTGRNTIILEDDAINIDGNFDNHLKFYLTKLPKDWDIFLLGFWLHRGDDGYKINDHIYKVKNFVLLHALIMTPRCAEKLLKLTPIDMPLDSWFSKHSDKINIYRHNYMDFNKQSKLIRQQRILKQIKNTNNW